MSKIKTKKLKIKTATGVVSGLLDIPQKTVAGLTLAHGAGAGMNHRFMEELSTSLTELSLAVLRFQFPYMEAGKKRTDSPAVAVDAVAAAVNALGHQLPKVPLFATGKSFGSRMSTTAAAEGLLPDIRGIICYGFPLHPAEQPGVKRAEHLDQVPVDVLFLQGTRDELADLTLMQKVCAKLPQATLHLVEGADHGFAVLKRSGRTPEDVLQELAQRTRRFIDAHLAKL